ncbi:9090_t:CDS:1 [Racocetra fulgida]|uniref:9090_t:CDS:1 n=1 Tax=Racocetra fulgida TaxID=60492 RepID=A0A9N9B1I7_9GLOM|nr:9090_t:CDS:1 [Racocetra fulgida]
MADNDVKTIHALEEEELAKHLLRHLKDVYEEYLDIFDKFLKRHYLIVALSGVVTLFGIVILVLKFYGMEGLLYSFKAVQSSFASLVSGGSIIAFGGSFLFTSSEKPTIDVQENDPKDGAIKLCIERRLWEKLEETIKKLRKKRELLETVLGYQAFWSVMASIVVLILVGADFLGLYPDNIYVGIGLNCLLSLAGIYFIYCAFRLYSVVSTPRKVLQRNRWVFFLFVVPCSLMVGLTEWNWMILYYAITPRILWGKKDGKNKSLEDLQLIEDVNLSPDDKVEILCLLRGLNPDISHMRIERFCDELGIDKYPELIPLLGTNNMNYSSKSGFIESINKIESQAKNEIFEKYFYLGESLVKCLNSDSQDFNMNDEEIIRKFASIDSSAKKQIYIHLFKLGKELSEFFEHSPQEKPKNLFPEEIEVAQNAIKIYSIFVKIGIEKIKLIRTFTVSTVGKFTNNEVKSIVATYKKFSAKNDNHA